MANNFHKNNIAQSVFEKNYNQLPDSKQEILNQKYNCSICLEIIKYENPFLCYECQKIFHHSCLEKWNERAKSLGKELSCPNCRHELSFDKWKVLLNYDENRTKDAQFMNQMGKAFNQNEFTKQSMNLFNIILNKLNGIHSLIENQKNYKLSNLIQEFQYNSFNSNITEISTAIIEELDLLEEFLLNLRKGIVKEEKEEKEEKIYKNEINIKYNTEEEKIYKIFGQRFMEINSNKISLIINGNKSPLVSEYNLKKGINNVTLCINNKLTNLSHMFDCCQTLYDIEELKYLNTEDVTDFSYMFHSTNKIDDIGALENWDTSKSETFKSMFAFDYSITSLSPLKKWNVLKCKDFSFMFYYLKHLTNIKPLENWNVTDGNNFSYMFSNCEGLSNLKPLENWNVFNGNDFSFMFEDCGIVNLKPLEKWNFQECNSFSGMFKNLRNLTNIKPLENWNVSNIKYFSSMFEECSRLSDLQPLEKWNVSNGTNFKKMFCGCIEISNIKPLKNWNVSKCIDFEYIFASTHLIDTKYLENWDVSNAISLKGFFADVYLLINISGLKNWNVSKCQDFGCLFMGCPDLTDVEPIQNWNVSKGNNFVGMFYSCSIKNRNLLQKWKFANQAYFKSMFGGN